MDLDPVEAGPLGAHRRRDEILDQLLDFAARQRPGPGLGVLGRTHRRVADQLGRRAQTGVMQLHRGHRAPGFDLGGQPA